MKLGKPKLYSAPVGHLHFCRNNLGNLYLFPIYGLNSSADWSLLSWVATKLEGKLSIQNHHKKGYALFDYLDLDTLPLL